MIKLTRLNGSKIIVNALLIERMESTPDTIVKLTTGTQFVVREPPEIVTERAVKYLRDIRCDSPGAPVAQIARTMR